jgi:anti-anti-sigma factor
MTERFAVHLRDDGAGVARVAVSGEVDADTGNTLSAVIAAAARLEIADVLIDMEHVSFLDAAGIRALILGRDAVRRQGHTYRVVNPQGLVRMVLEITGVLEILDVNSVEQSGLNGGSSQERCARTSTLAPRRSAAWP